VAIHRDEAGRNQHEETGLHERWGKVLDQIGLRQEEVTVCFDRERLNCTKSSASVTPTVVSQQPQGAFSLWRAKTESPCRQIAQVL
jgi:hypothetical protein